MRRTAEILTTLILFAVVMTALGWAAHAAAPGVTAWLDGTFGKIGAWAVIIVIWLAAGAYAWRAHRPKAGSAAGK